MKSISIARNQRGYAVIFFLFFIAAVALGVYSMYDTGWTASERIRLQNTADNTTYSTATMLSRDMNMMAITNRGMIANQVMIGQLVGLSSWSNYLAQVTSNIKTVATLANAIPIVGQVIYQVAAAVDQAVSTVSSVIDQVAKVLISTQNQVNGAISTLQFGYHGATYGMIPEMYEKVLKENDPNAAIESVAAIYNIEQFLSVMSSEFERNEKYRSGGAQSGKHSRENARIAQFGKLVNDSRDKFTADRSTSLGKYTVFPVRGGFDVRAGTDFVPSVVGGETHWEWTSLDAMSFNLGTWGCRRLRCRWRDTEIPVGWGAAHALNNGSNYNYSSNSGRTLRTHLNSRYNVAANTSRYWRNAFTGGRNATRRSAGLAGTYDSNNNLSNITGIRPFYDFRSNEGRNSTETLTLIFSKSTDSFRLRRNMADDFNAGYVGEVLNVDEKGSVPGNRIHALASAHVTFERPRDLPLAGSATPWAINWGRKDNLHEYGNLYNPFWEPKLTRTDAKLTQLAITAFGD